MCKVTSCFLTNVRNIAPYLKDFVSIIRCNIFNILLLNIKLSKCALKHLNNYAMKHSNYVMTTNDI